MKPCQNVAIIILFAPKHFVEFSFKAFMSIKHSCFFSPSINIAAFGKTFWCFFSLLSYTATRLREYIRCCMRCTAILKNDSRAEKRIEEEAFALASIAHYCFVETNLNCDCDQ